MKIYPIISKTKNSFEKGNLVTKAEEIKDEECYLIENWHIIWASCSTEDVAKSMPDMITIENIQYGPKQTYAAEDGRTLNIFFVIENFTNGYICIWPIHKIFV